MLIYYKILQIHAKTDSIILPNYSVENSDTPVSEASIACLGHSNPRLPGLSTTCGALIEACPSWSTEYKEGILVTNPQYKRTIDSEFWNKIYSEKEINKNSTVIFQIYFLISSLHTFEINENHLQKKPNTKSKSKLEQWIHQKYAIVYNTIITNIFMSSENKAEIEEIFYKTQCTYLALKKILHIYRFKKAQIKINTDLCLNIIDLTDKNNKNVFIVVQNNAKYMFTTRDILNLTMTSLKTHHNFFSEPHKPRNPYTNIPFTTADLYNIYFHISHSLLITPPLLTECFLNNFDMERFLVNNETKLRDFSIKNYILNSPHTILYNEVMYMIRRYFKDTQTVEYSLKNPNSKRTKQIVKRQINVQLEINKEFPREVLIDTMRPYLYLYLVSQTYIQGTEKKTIANKILKYTIRKFMRYNFKFGRKMITINTDTLINPFTQSNIDLTNKYKNVLPIFNTSHEIFTVFQAEEMLSTTHLIHCSENMSTQRLPNNPIIDTNIYNDNSNSDDDYYSDSDDDNDNDEYSDDSDNNTDDNDNILQEELVENVNEQNNIVEIQDIDPLPIFLPYSSENESTGYDSH